MPPKFQLNVSPSDDTLEMLDQAVERYGEGEAEVDEFHNPPVNSRISEDAGAGHLHPRITFIL